MNFHAAKGDADVTRESPIENHKVMLCSANLNACWAKTIDSMIVPCSLLLNGFISVFLAT